MQLLRGSTREKLLEQFTEKWRISHFFKSIMMAENWVNFSSSVFLISFLFNLFLLLSVSKMFTLGNKDILKYANLSRANICI